MEFAFEPAVFRFACCGVGDTVAVMAVAAELVCGVCHGCGGGGGVEVVV